MQNQTEKYNFVYRPDVQKIRSISDVIIITSEILLIIIKLSQ